MLLGAVAALAVAIAANPGVFCTLAISKKRLLQCAQQPTSMMRPVR